MTKEQVLKNNNLSTESCDELGTRMDDVEYAMDEWAEIKAKEQSIAFHKWADENAVRGGADKWQIRHDNFTEAISSDGLYEAFLTHQQSLP